MPRVKAPFPIIIPMCTGILLWEMFRTLSSLSYIHPCKDLLRLNNTTSAASIYQKNGRLISPRWQMSPRFTVLRYGTASMFPCYAQGPWDEEPVNIRRIRLVAMLSTTRPANFGVPGLGALNHATCEKALKLWFQILQVLLNLSYSRESG